MSESSPESAAKPSAPSGPLSGRTIALPESRELDRLAQMLEDEGARTWRCPLVAILDAPVQAPVEAWVRALAADSFDDLIFLTGEGLRRLVAVAERIGVREAAVAALARARTITRGPKPAKALHEIGLSPAMPAAVPTSRGVIEALEPLDLRGRRIGVQLYGTEPNRLLVDFLERAGAKVSVVAPYVYATASDTARVGALVATLADGGVDAIAFTSASQVDRLWQVARETGVEDRLVAGLARARVAAIGPIVADALAARRTRIDIIPDKSFVMRRLVNAIVESFGESFGEALGTPPRP
ncbi:MAG: uroporphyrinogen-III synthase [Myxococcales bacterium]|nr:uroporphyrinogen-III synthase [Myxococcales bacterium]